MTENRRELAAIAAQEALDGLRARRQLLLRAITPIVLFGCVLGVTLLLRGSDTRVHPDPYRIAVEGDFAGARQTLQQLNPARLVFVASSDARLDAATDADAGMRVPDQLDQLIANDSRPRIEIWESPLNSASRASATLVGAGFIELHARHIETTIGSSGGTRKGIAPILIDVQRTEAGTRSIAAQIASGLLLVEAALLVAGTANRLVSRRSRGLLAAQLLLPVSRRNLSFAKGFGELAVGVVAAAPVVGALVLFVAAIALRDGSTISALTHVAATVVALIALFLPFTALGLLIGTAARTQEQVTLVSGGAVVVAAMIAALIALGDAPRPQLLAVIPVVGIVSALRDVIDGIGNSVWFAIATTTSLLGAAAIATLAGRSLDAERIVLRNG